MKRRDEVVVGATIIFSVALVVVGAYWLSETRFGARSMTQTAQFRTVGGLGVGNPVVLRGVRVGRVQGIRITATDWVEAELQIYEGVLLPSRPAVLAASASLFGEWQAEIISLDDPPDDPNVRRQLDEALEVADNGWPGATLPDIGRLTAQAGRIATDIATVSSRIQAAFDSQTVQGVQRSIRNFGEIADTLARFTQRQTSAFNDVAENILRGSDVFHNAVGNLERTLARIDSATDDGQVDTLLADLMASAQQMRGTLNDLRSVVRTVQANQESMLRVLWGADSVMTRLASMQGTLGMLIGDSTLYMEASKTLADIQQLLADIKENPRKYFKFSVF